MIKEQETIIRLLDALYPGVKVYLFGSRARGTAKELYGSVKVIKNLEK